MNELIILGIMLFAFYHFGKFINVTLPNIKGKKEFDLKVECRQAERVLKENKLKTY